MSAKTHNILQQTCVFLSSNRESGDKENSKTSDEEIRLVCYNVRREIHDMFLSNYLTYFRSAQCTESLRRYLSQLFDNRHKDDIYQLCPFFKATQEKLKHCSCKIFNEKQNIWVFLTKAYSL